MEKENFASFSTVNFYAGSKLNRLSWLRSSSEFVNAALTSEDTRFIILNKLNPLVHDKGEKEGFLATLGWKDVEEVIKKSVELSGGKQPEGAKGFQVFGPEVYGFKPNSTGEDDKETQKSFGKATESVGPSTLALVFLGVDETQVPSRSLPGDLAGTKQQPAGIPYFALSISFVPHSHSAQNVDDFPMTAFRKKLEEDENYAFTDTRALAFTGKWPKEDAAVVAQARSLIDWNERNQHCPACSRRQYSVWAGYKRACASALRIAAPGAEFVTPFLGKATSFETDGLGDCPSVRLLSNFSYPRTDPVIIVGVLSPDGEKILLGRQKTWPKGFYSCLAGFLEPGESLEEATRREIHEEAGVGVGRVIYHSSQPWPFPANCMLGAFAEALPGQDSIRLDLDNELEDARWFTREEVLAVLGDSASSTLSKQELEKIDENERIKAEEERKKKQATGAASDKQFDKKDEGSVANAQAGSEADKKKPFRIPGATAIAHVLIASWARKEALIPQPAGGQTAKGRM